MKTRRSYPPEYKLEAVQLVTQKGYSVGKASKALNIGENMLRRWVNQFQQEQRGMTPKGKAITPEQEEIKRLQARIQQLEMEKDILKKATALMAEKDARFTK